MALSRQPGQVQAASVESSPCNLTHMETDGKRFFLMCPEALALLTCVPTEHGTSLQVLKSGEQCEAVCGPGLLASSSIRCQDKGT